MLDVVKEIFKRSSVFLILLGTVLLIFGASGGINISSFSAQVSNQITQLIIILIGIILIIVGVFYEIKNNNSAFSLTADDKDTPNQLGELNLAGTWYVYYGFDTKQRKENAVGIAKIDKPQGNKFNMTVHLNKSKLGRIIHNTFEYEGVIKNSQILCIFKSAGSLGDFMIGTMVMHPCPQGDKIFCGATYVNNFNKIIMDSCLLMKA